MRFIVDGPVSAPYQIFDTQEKDYVKGPYRTKGIAAGVCARMNKRKPAARSQPPASG